MNTEHVVLSVIIPVYNMERYIARCLDSVAAAQKLTDEEIEVLIINDGSKDNSKQIIKDYCARYAFMSLHDKENGGLSDVKNVGLRIAHGEYVIFLDADDYIDPRIFRVMLVRLKEEKAKIAVCGFELVFDDERKNHVPVNISCARDSLLANLLDTGLACASCNKIVRRELYDGLAFPNGKNNEDVAVTPIVLARADRIVYIDEPFYKYYQRAGSIQNSTFDERRFVILETARLCLNEAASLPQEKTTVIKGAVYVHQVLGVAYYLIRQQPIKRRYTLLKKYMCRTDELFEDIWQHQWVKERFQGESMLRYGFRRISAELLQRKLYAVCCLFWSVANLICK